MKKVTLRISVKQREKIIKNLESSLPSEEKYSNIRNIFSRIYIKSTKKRINRLKEKREKRRVIFSNAFPILEIIFNDGETGNLFTLLFPFSDINKTSDFIKFLKEVTKDDK